MGMARMGMARMALAWATQETIFLSLARWDSAGKEIGARRKSQIDQSQMCEMGPGLNKTPKVLKWCASKSR